MRGLPRFVPRARFLFPSRSSMLALELLAIACELARELLASLAGDRQAARVVLIEGQHRIDARDIVPPEDVGELACAKPVDAQSLERGTPDPQRRLEGLALGDLDAAQLQLEVVRHVARAAHDRQDRTDRAR